MKPASFDYIRPQTLEELLATLTDGDVLLAGGQSLLPDLNERRRRARRLVDVNYVTGLDACDFGGADSGQHRVVLGALTRHQDLAGRADARAAVPVLSEAARYVGHEAVRVRGTLGGSIANADPAAELPGVCVMLGAVARLRFPAGERTVDVASLARPGGLAEHEVITAVELPALRPGEGWGFRELSRPGAYAFPLVTVAATVLPGPGGTVAELRAAVTGAAPAPYALSGEAATGLVGARPAGPGDGEWADAVADELAAAADPQTDQYASAAYRRRIVRHLARQAVADALRRTAPGGTAGSGTAGSGTAEAVA
jgi:carbon-monoxide dehydrogenase medium subunit